MAQNSFLRSNKNIYFSCSTIIFFRKRISFPANHFSTKDVTINFAVYSGERAAGVLTILIFYIDSVHVCAKERFKEKLKIYIHLLAINNLIGYNAK